MGRDAEHSASLGAAERSRIIEMAWEDRTPFDAIRETYGLGEPAVRALMRAELKPAAFRAWRRRVRARRTKHRALRSTDVPRGDFPSQDMPAGRQAGRHGHRRG